MVGALKLHETAMNLCHWIIWGLVSKNIFLIPDQRWYALVTLLHFDNTGKSNNIINDNNIM